MPAKESFSAGGILEDEEDDQLQRSHCDRLEPEAEAEEEEDPEVRGEKRKYQDEDDEEGREEGGGGDEEEEDGGDGEEVKRGEGEGNEANEDDEKEEVEEEEEDSKGRSSSSLSGNRSEFMDVDLADIRKDVQCPICLGIIRKTRTVMECLHRFCRECIDKSMRLGNNECPACRKHCASRRSLRDDPKFDALIAALFTNIDKYEEEELAFHEEEEARNKQIQASIAEISQRQSDALVKRRSFGKEAAVLSRSQRMGNGSRRRRSCRSIDHHISEAHDDEDDDNARGKNSSSDDRNAEMRHRKRRKRSGNGPNYPSTSGANNSNCTDNDVEAFRDRKGISPSSLVWNPEILAWGRGGARSSTRHGNGSGGSNKSAKNGRLNRLVEYLRSLEGNGVELDDIHLKLVPLDTKCISNLQQSYLCCRPTMLVKQLREFVAIQTELKSEEIELLVGRGEEEGKAIENPSLMTDDVPSLEDDETLARLKVDYFPSLDHLIIGYRQKHLR